MERLSILGVGLLGGSIGLAVKKRLSGCTVVGYGHRPETLKRARELGAIDETAPTAAAAVAGADLVILCTPVGLFEAILTEIGPALKDRAIVTDVGSTKRSVVELAEKVLPTTARFVGSHPMAGSEKRGVEFATADLFEKALCILTPTERTRPDALRVVRDFWQSLGSRTQDLSPANHDKMLAEVSHLPHAVAAALVSLPQAGSLEFAGKGFLDTTRIAGGDGGLWRDILLDNRDNMVQAIDTLTRDLGRLSELLKGNRTGEVAEWLDRAAKRRNQLGTKNEPRTK